MCSRERGLTPQGPPAWVDGKTVTALPCAPHHPFLSLGLGGDQSAWGGHRLSLKGLLLRAPGRTELLGCASWRPERHVAAENRTCGSACWGVHQGLKGKKRSQTRAWSLEFSCRVSSGVGDGARRLGVWGSQGASSPHHPFSNLGRRETPNASPDRGQSSWDSCSCCLCSPAHTPAELSSAPAPCGCLRWGQWPQILLGGSNSVQ